MPQVSKASLRRYQILFKRLRARSPQKIAEALALSRKIIKPSLIRDAQLWRIMWDKPVYSGWRVAVAARCVTRLEVILRDQPINLAIWSNQFRVRFVRIARAGNNPRNYIINGQNALRAHQVAGAPLHRLFAIQGAAQCFSTWQGQLPRDFLSWDIRKKITDIIERCGRGWAPITAAHLLTDLGLAIKPDIHVTATVRYLGLLTASFSTIKRPRNLNEVCEVIEAVERLNRSINPNLRGTALAKARRQLDKILMEISREELLPIGHRVNRMRRPHAQRHY